MHDIDKLAQAMQDAAIRYANGHTVDFQHEAREFAISDEQISNMKGSGMKNIDLDALERALIGSAMGLTFRECQLLIKHARSLESQLVQTSGAEEPVAWLVDIPDEPELGHWFAEESAPEGYRSRPLYTAPAAQQAQGEAYAKGRLDGMKAAAAAVVGTQYGSAFLAINRVFAAELKPQAASPAGHDATGTWQPIDTAPKDRVIQLWVPTFGTWVDGPWRGAWSHVVGQWALHSPFTAADGRAITATEIPHPTHWMPLQDEPREARGATMERTGEQKA